MGFVLTILAIVCIIWAFSAPGRATDNIKAVVRFASYCVLILVALVIGVLAIDYTKDRRPTPASISDTHQPRQSTYQPQTPHRVHVMCNKVGPAAVDRSACWLSAAIACNGRLNTNTVRISTDARTVWADCDS